MRSEGWLIQVSVEVVRVGSLLAVFCYEFPELSLPCF